MTIKQQVENVLAVSNAGRNSHKEVQVIFMQKYGMALTPEQIEIFKKMPSMESIRRDIQIIQNREGKYRPTKEVEDARYEKFEKMKSTHAEDPDKILHDSKGNNYEIPFNF
jgi:hypothetical protein